MSYIKRDLESVIMQANEEYPAIIAYRQPITRLEVEEIRGVKCDYSIQMLCSRDLITDVGRKDTVGHPILYGTTDAFLAHFGIKSLDELPTLDVAGEDEEEMPI